MEWKKMTQVPKSIVEQLLDSEGVPENLRIVWGSELGILYIATPKNFAQLSAGTTGGTLFSIWCDQE